MRARPNPIADRLLAVAMVAAGVAAYLAACAAMDWVRAWWPVFLGAD
jgi:hypothetical protein